MGGFFAWLLNKERRPVTSPSGSTANPDAPGLAYGSTRGLRNNNPGNIRHGDQWQGMAKHQPDPEFITFITPAYGIRAMARLIKNYQRLYGLESIEAIIYRWAPETENNTESYVKAVAARMQYPRWKSLDLNDPEVMHSLISAIIHHENGAQPYTTEISHGVMLA